jgi:hypothetical protein
MLFVFGSDSLIVVVLPLFWHCWLLVGFWFSNLFSDLLRFAGIKVFNSASALLVNLGRPTTLRFGNKWPGTRYCCSELSVVVSVSVLTVRFTHCALRDRLFV